MRQDRPAYAQPQTGAKPTRLDFTGDPRPSWRNTRQTETTDKLTTNCEKPTRTLKAFRMASRLVVSEVCHSITNRTWVPAQVGSAKRRPDLPDRGRRVSSRGHKRQRIRTVTADSWRHPIWDAVPPLSRSREYSSRSRFGLRPPLLWPSAGRLTFEHSLDRLSLFDTLSLERPRAGHGHSKASRSLRTSVGTATAK